MTEEQRRRLRNIKTFPQLLAYLRDELDWPIDDGHDEDDLTFDWSDDLGLKDDELVGIKAIKQLRPLESNQPWGIFFVDFEKKKLPIVILRRILNALVVKKRAGANKAERAAWKQHDLLFISAYGADNDRQLTFAHFSEPSGELDDKKATLRVLGWDGDDTNLKLDHVADVLHANLRWPQGVSSIANWRQKWAEAFELRHRQVIDTAEDLALRLAELAKRIRNRMLDVLPRESEKGELQRLFKGFKTALIHELDEKQFADMYAQTITYGLFSAAVSRTVPGAGTAVAQDNVVDMVPITNPFLREMLQSFLKAGGRKRTLDFDELGIQEVVDLLNDPSTKMEAVLRDFGNSKRDEDPVIHFYEGFAKLYDPIDKVRRGEFYTPQPVVSYIVRSVHELLQSEFGLEDGLADTATWGAMLKRHPELRLPMLQNDVGDDYPLDENEPFVQILDPATGTGTFLVEVIDVIYRTMTNKWRQHGLSSEQRKIAWNKYVPEHLLPRLHAYELKMAPYAIAHMKIGLKLKETGYSFDADERARIYLTNALEPWQKQLVLPDFEALAHEATAVNEIKRHKHFTVVIGNPPYSGESQNKSDWIVELMGLYKREPDGSKLREKNSKWINADEIKFIRSAHWRIAKTGQGIVGLIASHTWLSAPIFRGMRSASRNDFDEIYGLDLHGNGNKNERTPLEFAQLGDDKNVFDILQGVAILFLIRRPGTHAREAAVRHAEFWGSRESKYSRLANSEFDAIEWRELAPHLPQLPFVPINLDAWSDYERGWSIAEIFPLNGTGIVTKCDELNIHWDADEAWNAVRWFAKASEAEARKRFKLPKPDVRDWKFDWAQHDVRGSDANKQPGPHRDLINPILYRPFDTRYTYYTGQSRGVMGWPVERIMQHLMVQNNFGLVSARSNKSQTQDQFFVADKAVETKAGESTTQSATFPLWLLPDASIPTRHPNLDPRYLKVLADAIGLGTTAPFGLPDGVTPEDIFHFIYAVLYASTYRSRYTEYLRSDFPRIPLPRDLSTFRALAALGEELVSLHLLQSAKLETPLTQFVGSSHPKIEKVFWSNDTVWLDKAQTTGFRGVPEVVWNFHIGGYQVCEKWLKDRGPKKRKPGRTLSDEDITHYHKIVVALSETIRLMGEIDEAIAAHGGWPGAFSPTVSQIVTQPVRYAPDGIPNSAEEAWTIGLIWYVLRESSELSHANLREILSWRDNPLPSDIPDADANAAWKSVRPGFESKVPARAAVRLDLMLDYLRRRNLVRQQGSVLLAIDGDLPTEIIVNADTATTARLLLQVLKGVPQPESNAAEVSPPQSKQA